MRPATEVSYVLQVQESVSGRRWLWRGQGEEEGHERLIVRAQELAQLCDIPELTARILLQRGHDPQKAELFLKAKLRDLMPEPFSLKDMDRAAERLALAAQHHEKIGIFGDYDVDGISASTLLYDFFTDRGVSPFVHIPDRLQEGYGPNQPALEAFIAQGATLIICVDCGTSSSKILDPLSKKADIIIFDHHKAQGQLPHIYAVVNPQQTQCQSGQKGLCATAITFLAIIATFKILCREKYCDTADAKHQLPFYLDLVALATICDVMPLRGPNRAFVKQGLAIMAHRQRIGLSKLMDEAGIKREPDGFSCGFVLGPRINSGGRIAQADLGLRLLTTKDAVQAQYFAGQLDQVNHKRRDVEQDVLQIAMERAKQQRAQGHQIIFLDDPAWHPGIVGIIAGRIKEAFNRPTFIANINDHGEIKGSARSVAPLDVGAAIINARESGIIQGGGGHAMAGGFSLSKQNREKFHAFLEDNLKEAQNLPLAPDLFVDAIISAEGASYQCGEDLKILAPFGPGHPEPILVIPRIHIAYSVRIGRDKNTLRVILQSPSGARVTGLLFKIDKSPLRPILEDKTRPLIHVAGQLHSEIYNDQPRVTFFIKDVATAQNAH